MNGRTAEQRLVAAVSDTAEKTVQRWADLPDACLRLNWAEIGLLAHQHRIEGLLYESLELAGCADQIPTSVVSMLRRRADLAEARYRACCDVLVELHRRAPDLVAEMVFFQGADLVLRYGSPAHRMVGDFDFVVAAERDEELRRVFEELDFWEKPGPHGPMYCGSAIRPQIGAEYVVFDMHVGAPPRADHPRSKRAAPWISAAVPHAIGEVACRRLPVELAVLESLVHTAERALSWIHACLDDDVRLIRQLDVELLCEQEPVDAQALAGLADHLDLSGELALGLAVHRALRGSLPPPLAGLGRYADAVADLADAVALPDGRIEEWPVPLDRRAYRTDRGALALAMMPDGARTRAHWFDWRRGLVKGTEDIAAVVGRAAQRLR
jgi:hypothetical protein